MVAVRAEIERLQNDVSQSNPNRESQVERAGRGVPPLPKAGAVERFLQIAAKTYGGSGVEHIARGIDRVWRGEVVAGGVSVALGTLAYRGVSQEVISVPTKVVSTIANGSKEFSEFQAAFDRFLGTTIELTQQRPTIFKSADGAQGFFNALAEAFKHPMQNPFNPATRHFKPGEGFHDLSIFLQSAVGDQALVRSLGKGLSELQMLCKRAWEQHVPSVGPRG